MALIDLFTPAGLAQYALALTRVGAVMMPLGIPNAQRVPAVIRLLWAAVVAAALWPQWFRPPSGARAGPWEFGGELCVGMMIGLAVTAALEGLFTAMHLAGLQTGYQYASTIDPTTQADSPVLPVLSQIFGSLVFFAVGGDAFLIRATAESFAALPLGEFPAGLAAVESARRTGTVLLQTAIQMSLPIVALMVIVDLTAGVVSRAHAQLQLISIAFPLKMLLALTVIAALLPVWGRVLAERTGAQAQSLNYLAAQ